MSIDKDTLKTQTRLEAKRFNDHHIISPTANENDIESDIINSAKEWLENELVAYRDVVNNDITAIDSAVLGAGKVAGILAETSADMKLSLTRMLHIVEEVLKAERTAIANEYGYETIENGSREDVKLHRKLVVKTVSLGSAETVINGVSLFTGGNLAGGIAGGMAVSAIVAGINVGLGWMAAEQQKQMKSWLKKTLLNTVSFGISCGLGISAGLFRNSGELILDLPTLGVVVITPVIFLQVYTARASFPILSEARREATKEAIDASLAVQDSYEYAIQEIISLARAGQERLSKHSIEVSEVATELQSRLRQLELSTEALQQEYDRIVSWTDDLITYHRNGLQNLVDNNDTLPKWVFEAAASKLQLNANPVDLPPMQSKVHSLIGKSEELSKSIDAAIGEIDSLLDQTLIDFEQKFDALNDELQFVRNKGGQI